MKHAEADLTPSASSESAEAEDFRWRLRWICERVGGVVPLADNAGMAPPVLRRWLAGSSEPNRTRLVKLAQAAEVAEDWLASGEGVHLPYRLWGDRATQTLSDPEAFRQRLALLAGKAKSVLALGRAIGVAESTIRGWLDGPSEPTRGVLVRLARASDVRLQWLLVGQEPADIQAVVADGNVLFERECHTHYDEFNDGLNFDVAAREIAAWRESAQPPEFDQRRKPRISPPRVPVPPPSWGGIQTSQTSSVRPGDGSTEIGFASTRVSPPMLAQATTGGDSVRSKQKHENQSHDEDQLLRRVRWFVMQALLEADVDDLAPEEQIELFEYCVQLIGQLGKTPRCQERLAQRCSSELVMALLSVFHMRHDSLECKS